MRESIETSANLHPPSRNIEIFRLNVLERPSGEDVLKIGRLRTQAWHETYPSVAANSENKGPIIDPIDYAASHWLVSSGSNLIAASRLSIHTDPRTIPDWFEFSEPFKAEILKHRSVASLCRMAVLRSHQGRGLANTLLEQRLARASQIATLAIATVIEPRVPVFQSYGFSLSGSSIGISRYPELKAQEMYRQISAA